MNLDLLITPKNIDGSIDHRYHIISKEICSLAGEECLTQLKEFYEKTSCLEIEHGAAAIHLVRKSFQIEMDEYQRKRVTKALITALKELGFKSSKVTKIINAGRFLQTYDWHEEGRCYFGSNSRMTGQDFIDKLSEYFDGFGAGSLDVLSRTNKQGRKKAYRHFARQGTRMSQKSLEALQRQYPSNRNEKRGEKPDRDHFQETPLTHALAVHESLKVMDDAEEQPMFQEPESGQKLVKQFCLFLSSGEMDRCLSRFAPAAQAHMIDDIEAVKLLLEELISKHQTIEVTPIH